MAIYAGLSSIPTHQTTLLRDCLLSFNVLLKQKLSRGNGIFLHMLLSVIIYSLSSTTYQATQIHMTALYQPLSFLKSSETKDTFGREIFFFFFGKRL